MAGTDKDLLTTQPDTPGSKEIAKAAAAAKAASPLPPLRKPELEKSEAWAGIFTVLGTIGAGLSMTGTAGKIIALVSIILTAGAYAYFHTPLPSEHPGWHTRAFFGAAASIVGSIALALSEANLPFLPKGVTADAALLSASISAGGYTVYRYRVKVAKK